MTRYIAGRLLLLLPLLFGLSIVTFMYVRMIPGDPIQAMLGSEGSDILVKQLRHEYGFDQPLLAQYVSWLGGVLRGDLGLTLRSQQPITPLLISRLPATLQLLGGGLIVALLFSLPFGFLAAVYKSTKLDYIFSIFSLAGLSTPIFWIGTIFILVIGLNLHWLPTQGYTPLADDPIASLKFMLLPAITLGLTRAPYIARMTRAAVVETLQEPYVRYAHAKGLPEPRVRWRYVIRSAIVPVVVVVGLQIGNMLGGQIIVEELFNWPGTGRLIVGAIIERDYFTAQAVILYYATLVILLQFAVELIQAWLDPRIRLE